MKQKANKVWLCAAAFLFWFSQYVHNPYMTPYLLSLGITATFAGTIVGAFGFTQMLARLPIGLCADHLKRHKVFIVLGMVCAIVTSLIRWLFPQPVPLLIAGMFSGLASSAWISFMVLFSEWFDRKDFGKSVSLMVTMNNGGTLLAYLLGGLLYPAFGMVSLFIAGCVSGVLGFACLLFVKEGEKKERGLPILKLLPILKDKQLLIFTGLAVVFNIVIFATSYSFTSKLVENLSGSGAQISLCSSLWMVSSMLSSWFVGTKAAGRIGDRNLMVFFFLLLGLYAILVPLAGTVAQIMVLQLFGGLGSSGLFSLLTSNAVKNAPGEQRSTAMGFFQSVYALGITLGPLLMGAFVDSIGYTAGFAVIGGCACLCAVAIALFYRWAIRPAHPKA